MLHVCKKGRRNDHGGSRRWGTFISAPAARLLDRLRRRCWRPTADPSDLLVDRRSQRHSVFPVVALLIGAFTLFFAGAPAGAQTTVRLSVENPEVSEGKSTGSVSVKLSAPLSMDVTIPVKVGLATGDFTYTDAAGGTFENPSIIRLTIPRDSRTSTINGTLPKITARSDEDTDHEFIRLELDGENLPAGVEWASPISVLIGVKDLKGDTDREAYLSVSPNPVREGERTLLYVHLSDHLPYDVTIPVTVTPGSAEDNDYVAPPASITIPRGSTPMPVGIRTVVDADEDEETFTVALGTSLPPGVTAGSPNTVTVTISEDAPPPPDTGGGSEGGGEPPNTGGGGPGGGGGGGGAPPNTGGVGGSGGSGGSGGGDPTQSSDASLRGLLISDGTPASDSARTVTGRSGSLSAGRSEEPITLAFGSGRTSYAVAVAHVVEGVKLTPTVNHAGATVAVNGTVVESGTASGAIPLGVGENPIYVVVTAEDGTTQTYRVTVTRGTRVLGAAEKALVDKVGMALLGRDDPGVYPPEGASNR